MGLSLRNADVLLLELLQQQQIVDQDVVLEAAKHASDMSMRLADVLFDNGVLSAAELAGLLSAYTGLPRATAEDFIGDDELLSSFPLEWMRSYRFFPIQRVGDSLFLVSSEVLDGDYLQELRELLACECNFYVGTDEEVVKALDKAEGRRGLVVQQGVFAQEPVAEELEETHAHVGEFVDLVLTQGVGRGASDIHIEPDEARVRIRYRIDGTFVEMDAVASDLLASIVVRVKALAGMNVSENRLPQDGRIELNNQGRSIDMRVAILPTEHGEMVCIRVLDRERVKLDLDLMGLSAGVLRGVREVINRPNGIFLVTGPTGSGKSTTLYGCLSALNSPRLKILTAEDPVEYEVDGVLQVQTHDKIGLDYSRILRAFLRQDPDVIMVGEIRDEETAAIAVQASLTGHLVLSTLHTNDAVASITRLEDLGVERYLIASSLLGVLAQRLVRGICKLCRRPQLGQEAKLELLGVALADAENTKVYHGIGCEACDGTGFKGRLPIAEYFSVNSEIKSLIVANVDERQIRDFAIKSGMITLRQQGLQEIFSGRTTVDEVLTWVQ